MVALAGFLFGSLLSFGLYLLVFPFGVDVPEWLELLAFCVFYPGVFVGTQFMNGFSASPTSALFYLGFVVNGLVYTLVALLVYWLCAAIRRRWRRKMTGESNKPSGADIQ